MRQTNNSMKVLFVVKRKPPHHKNRVYNQTKECSSNEKFLKRNICCIKWNRNAPSNKNMKIPSSNSYVLDFIYISKIISRILLFITNNISSEINWYLNKITLNDQFMSIDCVKLSISKKKLTRINFFVPSCRVFLFTKNCENDRRKITT